MRNTVETYWANIWIGGDVAVAVQTCREFCMGEPLCVTVMPTTFVYVAGAEAGVCVRLFNYPRFPVAPEVLHGKAERLAARLMTALCQRSYSIEYPDKTVWQSIDIGESR